MGIFLGIFSLGILVRGILYYIVSLMPMNSKFKSLSISKSEDALEYTEENLLASKAYIVIGIIVFIFTIILLVTFYEVIVKYNIIYIISIFLIDLFVNTLINIRISIDKYDKSKKEGE